ncbi:hypothetical protein RN001_003856 [Aquatica leii]|uniref:KIF-binding protein n=1 Tax=Aquatica leii TaxID=1421715 RepID=A0AAN7QBZ7_9COLE|nr:hypothetical protein RN001_003856 [Aquatica leii]
MTITKESYVDLQEKYEKVKKLIEEDSKLDPANEPYISKYNAKQLLIGMKANIENLLRSQAPDTKEYIKLTAMLGTTLLYLGRISIETEELSAGEKHLKKCLDTITPYEMEPDVILVVLNLLNEFGCFWSEREPENSKGYLEKAEQLYKQFKETSLVPIDIHYLFQVNPEHDTELSFKNLEKVHTLTLYYLAQIYGALDDPVRSAVYCHITLKRQLQIDDYNLIEWALNAATLSQFFMEKNGFKQARHHLAASSYILEIYQNQLNQITERNDEYDAKMENFKHRSADIARCWAKYGLLLLSCSRDRLMNHSEDIDSPFTLSTDLAKLELEPDSLVTRENLENLKFDTLNLTMQENQVTDQFILTLEDARKVFLNIKTWLERAHNYYTLNNLASDYIEIVQDQSQMYLNLSFFEDNPENQAKMRKRRIDLMEGVLKEINPTYYMRYCRQLWCDLAADYVEILYIKLDKLKQCKDRPSANTLTKINNLVDKGIFYNNSFIHSFKESNSEKLPENIPEDYVTPFLKAHLSNGALYSRYIVLDKRMNLEHVKSSLECYKQVLYYCEKNPKFKETAPVEHGICTEMVALLPVKILKLQQELPPED